MTPQQFEALCGRITKQEAIIAKAASLVTDLKAKRRSACPHTTTEPQEYYFPGSFDDKAYTQHWNRCVCCGLTDERKYEQHSWYG